MNILICGLGALGIVFAVALKFAGNSVFGITKEKYFESLKNKPLKIKGLFGQKETFLDGIYVKPQELIDLNLDLIIVSVKSYDTEKAINQIKPLIGENTLILLAQNGYGNYEIAGSIVDKRKIILSRIIFGAKINEIGFAEVTVFADDIVIGQPDNLIPSEKLIEISHVFNKSGIPTRVSNDVYAILWDKILYNCALNPLGAILECNYGSLAEMEETRFLMNQIVYEIFNVAKANEIKLNWPNADDYLKFFYEKLVPPTAMHFPSMYYDLKNGKKTEIDSLNGAIVNLAKQKIISVPINETITKLIRAKEKLFYKN